MTKNEAIQLLIDDVTSHLAYEFYENEEAAKPMCTALTLLTGLPWVVNYRALPEPFNEYRYILERARQ